jgi:hypothetical protein
VETETLVKEAKKFYKNSKNYALYEYYKRKLRTMNIPPNEYETTIYEIAKILGV